jgi:hypothetical protein
VKRIYIACPISRPDTPAGLLANVRRADAAMLALMRAGYAVFNPALSVYAGGCDTGVGQCETLPPVYAAADRRANGEFQELSHADWLAMDFAWIEVSDAVLRLPGESVGADAECEHAGKVGVPVFDDMGELVAAMGAAITPSSGDREPAA